MPGFWEYIRENLALSFASWAQGQKVGTLLGLLFGVAIGAAGLAGVALIEPTVQRYWPVALAIFFFAMVLIITPFRLWRRERVRAESAEAKLIPKLRCAFGDQIPGCVRPNTTIYGMPVVDYTTGSRVVGSMSVTGTYHRLAVEAIGLGTVRNCAARIPWIKRNGRRWFDGEYLIMPFVPSEAPDCDRRDIVAGRQELVDFLFIGNDQILITTKGFVVPTSINFPEMFRTPAEYLFRIEISSPDSSPVAQEIKLFWTGKSATSRVIAA
jgi:hypothetical protein